MGLHSFLAAVAFCNSLFWLVLTSLKYVASIDGGEHVETFWRGRHEH